MTEVSKTEDLFFFKNGAQSLESHWNKTQSLAQI